MIKRLSSLILILFLASIAFAMDASTIYYASDLELEKMVLMRGLETAGRASMQKALYEYEGLDTYTVKESGESDFNLKIKSAENLEKDGDALVISGNACISLSTDKDGEKTLRAGKIVVDIVNKQITALENVSLSDSSKDAAINEISADIISVFWENEEFSITDATTSSNRKNSEGDAITFYTAGKRLTYLPEGGIIYEDGFISSDPVNRYSSLNAEKISMLPGGDMFISNATLSIGRVPVLYLPFFFFPGSRILGNPAFGFDSAKGAFLNTTFEVLGSSPNVEKDTNNSSFTAILQSSSDNGYEETVGYYYDAKDEPSNYQAWAKDSESYISILADAYSGENSYARLSNGLIHFGLDSKINLANKKLKLVVQDGFGFSNPANKDINDSIFRYYGINSLSYSDYGLALNATFPFYSDNYVLVDMLNRLVGFSLDPLLGQDIEFPNTYSQSLSSYSRALELSYRLPSKYTNKYLSNLALSNLKFKSLYAWSSSSANKGYILDEIEKPTLNFSVSGAFYDLSTTVSKNDDNQEMKEENIHTITDPLLSPLYNESDKSTSSSSSTIYSSSLKYNLSEELKYKDDYTCSILTSSLFSSTTSARFTLDAKLGSFFSLSDVLTPSYTYSYTEKYKDEITSAERVNKSSMNNELKLSIPYIGLSYTLSLKLLDNKKNESWNEGISSSFKETNDKLEFSWDKNSVKQHQIAFSKSFETDAGTFSPSITYVLKPLVGAIQPKLGYKYGPFTTALQWKFLEENENQYSSDLIEFSLGYSGSYVVFSSAMKYQSADYDKSDFFLPLSYIDSLTIKSKDSKWSINQYIDYSVYSKKTDSRNYFNSIKTTLSSPYGSVALNWKTQDSDKKVDFNDLAIKLKLSTDPWQFWKGRIYLKLGLDSSFTMNMNNLEGASFTISPSLTFSIAEFLDFKFTINSYNNNFYSYFDNGLFKFEWMMNDLFRSFDFFGTGREHTNFLMRSASLDVVHYMEDWDLHCTYSTDFVQSGNVYTLMPRLSVYLSWKTMPDLKVDEKWKQTQGSSGRTWVRE